MPCLLYGVIVVTDEERFIQEASKCGIILDTESAKEWVKAYQKGGRVDIKEIMRNYNTAKIKQVAQKKGWKVTNVSQLEDKIVIRIRE